MELVKEVDGVRYYLAAEGDITKILQIDRRCFPEELRAPAEHFREIINFFPNGTFLATHREEPVGYICTLPVDDSYLNRLEELLQRSLLLPLPQKQGRNLLYESLAVSEKGKHIARELILCTEAIIKRYGVTRLVAVLETSAGNRLTTKLGFKTVKRVQTKGGEAIIKERSSRGFIKKVREAL